METAVLDACVLFPGGVRDFLLWVAEAGAFSPAWSDVIHEEWMRNRREKFNDSISRLEYARAEMENAFPGANFDPDPHTLATVTLPDMNDVHVVAAAVAAQARTIVTYDTHHFPASALYPLALRKETPDAFCARLFVETQAEVVEGARSHRTSLKRPSYDPDSYLVHLKSNLRLNRTSDLLRAVKDSI